VTRKTYRSQQPDVLLFALSGVLLLALPPIPISAAVTNGGAKSWAAGIILTPAMAGAGIAAIACQVSNRLLVDSDSLTYHHNLLTRRIAWPEVLSVETTNAEGYRGRACWLQVETPQGQKAIKSVVASRAYIEDMAAEISGLAADMRADSATQSGSRGVTDAG